MLADTRLLECFWEKAGGVNLRCHHQNDFVLLWATASPHFEGSLILVIVGEGSEQWDDVSLIGMDQYSVHDFIGGHVQKVPLKLVGTVESILW